MPDDPSGALAASLGALRWLVTLYRRDQSPADDMALQENLVPLATVHANVQSSRPSTFFASTQIDGPVTHMIDIRWQDYPATIDVVVRSTYRPNDDSWRTELFRVRRSTEIAGRKRFIRLECELEHARTTPDDSDATRNELLTEPYSDPPAVPIDRTAWDDGSTAWDDAGSTQWDIAP